MCLVLQHHHDLLSELGIALFSLAIVSYLFRIQLSLTSTELRAPDCAHTLKKFIRTE